jgi:membrane protein DedA with SNARE-associated domain
VLFVGTFLEGETVLLLGGAAARLGYLRLEWVIACALLGSLLGVLVALGLSLWVIRLLRHRRARRGAREPE